MNDMSMVCILLCIAGIVAIAAGVLMLAFDCWQWCKRHRKPRFNIKDAWKGEWH